MQNSKKKAEIKLEFRVDLSRNYLQIIYILLVSKCRPRCHCSVLLCPSSLVPCHRCHPFESFLCGTPDNDSGDNNNNSNNKHQQQQQQGLINKNSANQQLHLAKTLSDIAHITRTSTVCAPPTASPLCTSRPCRTHAQLVTCKSIKFPASNHHNKRCQFQTETHSQLRSQPRQARMGGNVEELTRGLGLEMGIPVTRSGNVTEDTTT